VGVFLKFLRHCAYAQTKVIQRGTVTKHTKASTTYLIFSRHYIHAQTRSNLAGTPRYMAPEAYRDEKCTEKIDIYSLAMMMWEMLTSQLPWDGSNFQVFFFCERICVCIYIYIYIYFCVLCVVCLVGNIYVAASVGWLEFLGVFLRVCVGLCVYLYVHVYRVCVCSGKLLRRSFRGMAQISRYVFLL